MIVLKYGNTFTYLVSINDGYLLVDTDYAGSINFFYKEIKNLNIKVEDIKYVLATHYHPDHCGLIGNLMELGVKLLLVDNQINAVDFSDDIFEREKIPYKKIDKEKAIIINSENSRDYLKSIGINGEIIKSFSHSEDGICLYLDNGEIIVGDIYSFEYIDNIENNEILKGDWKRIKNKKIKVVHYAHRPDVNYE